MKNKKILTLIAAIIISSVVGGVFYFGTLCKVDGSSVCYDKDLEVFELEEHASLKIGVETEETKVLLSEIIEKEHPKLTVSIDVIDAYTRVELSEELIYDILYVDGSEAKYFMPKFKNLGQKAQEIIADNIPIGLQDSFNINGLRFVPQNVTGQELLLNVSLLERIGLERDDVSSFENIKKNQDLILEHLDITFPFTFKDPLAFYPYITGGGWTLNYTHDGMNPDFNSEKFLKSMEFIEFLSTMKLNNDEEVSSTSLKYHNEDKFFMKKSLFGFIHDTQLAEQFKSMTDDEWIGIPFPTFEGKHLAQEVSVNGYVVNEETKYPSASAEVLRILRQPDFLDKGIKSLNPIITPEYYEGLDKALIDKIEQFGHSDLMTILALDVNPSIKASDILNDIDYMSVVADVFDGKLTPEEAQNKMIEMADEWLMGHTPPEETEDDVE